MIYAEFTEWTNHRYQNKKRFIHVVQIANFNVVNETRFFILVVFILPIESKTFLGLFHTLLNLENML